jgi:23S rRNA (uracil1939-C5)-methyltransferase
MAVGGEAVARDAGGRVVFVEGALPGETVDVIVYDQRASYARASVTEVISPAPERVAPPCPHVARGCGGCGWQHIAPAAQVVFKIGLVVDALRRLGGVNEPEVRPGPALPSFGYRTTLQVAVAGGPGFRRHRGHQVVEVDSCLVSHPLLEDVLAHGHFGTASAALLRAGARTGERMAVLTPTAAGASLGAGVRAVGQDELDQGRRAWIFEEVAGARLRISAGSFFQARPDGAEVLVDLVGRALEDAPPGPLVDAYGGVGLFGATVGRCRPVTLLESSPSAVADARVNLPAARVRRVDVAHWRPAPAAAVVADPPRAGLGRRAAGVLAATGASHLALVSCDPASFGRDAALLAAHGFALRWATVVDMFPGTPHVEVVGSFIRVGTVAT